MSERPRVATSGDVIMIAFARSMSGSTVEVAALTSSEMVAPARRAPHGHPMACNECHQCAQCVQ